MNKPLALCCFFVFLMMKTNAQQIVKTDTNYQIKDTLINVPLRYRYCKRRSPLLAGVLELMLPTAGQIYNKQYLKAGVIWGVAAVTTIGTVASWEDHRLHSNGTTTFFVTLLVTDAVFSLVDAPISSLYLNKKYNLKPRKRSFSSLHINPDLINAGIANKFDPGISLVLR